MSEFDVIECGFNIADQTINFGSRMLADGDHLFEASTLAAIKQSEVNQKLSDINVLACSFESKLYYVINNSIGIFTDLSCTELLCKLSFEECIDVFYVTSGSKYLFICLRNGTILYVDVKRQEVLCNEELGINNCLEECYFINCFLEEYLNNGIKLIIITKTGYIYRVILENVNDGNYTCSTNLIKDIQFQINTSALIYPLLFMDGEKMIIYNLETDDNVEDDTLNLLKSFPYGQDMFIGLDVEGNLVRICTQTFLVFHLNNIVKFKDLVFTSFPFGEHITKNPWLCISTENDIQFYDTYPDMLNLKFSLKVSNNVRLILPGSIDEDCMYISIIDKEQVVQEIRIQVIYETAPEVRLKTLLRRQMFDDAERFAKLFDLSNTEVLMAKAQVIVDKRTCCEGDVCNLIDILNKIDDTSFKLQSCFDTYQSCENLSDARQILNYTCNSVVANASPEILEKYHEILDTMNQLDKFVLIQKLEISSDSDWIEFVKCDQIEQLCEYLQRCNIDAAIVLYIHLDKHSKLNLNDNVIETILNILDSLPMDMYQPFLYCFIPLSLSYLPTTLPLFIKWLKRKVFFIEQTSSIGFPKNAIEFTNSTLELMKVDSENINFQQQNTLHKEATNDLINLVKALKTILLLKDIYEIKVPLKEFLKGPKSLIETLLTFDLDEKHAYKFLQRFLCKFMLENNLEPNTIFLDAIRNLLQYEESYWIKIVPPILYNINIVEIKLTAIISIIEVSSVPWNQEIRDIARSALQYRHQLVETIKKLIKHEPLYAILMKPSYNIQDIVINSSWDIEYPISRIIYCNESTMVHDIYQLCITSKDRHTANIMLIKHFIEIRDFQKALDILDSNSSQDIKKICQSIVNVVKLNDELNLHHQNEPYFEMLQCLERRLKNIEGGNEHLPLSVRNILACSKIRTTLYNSVNNNDLEDPGKKKILLDTLLHNISQDIADGTTTVHEALNTFKKIACLLNESKQMIMLRFCELYRDNFELIKECANYVYRNEYNSKNLCLMAIIILKSIGLSISPDVLDFTLGMNITLLKPLNNVQYQIECLDIAHHLAAKALLHSACHEINACVEVFHWTTSTVFMTWENSSIQRDFFPHIHFPQDTFPSLGSLNTVKFVFNVYTSFSVASSLKNTSYLTHYESAISKLSEDELASRIQQLPIMIQNFCLEGQALTALKLIKTFKCYLTSNKTINPNFLDILNTIIAQCMVQLLQKIFGANVIDIELAYNLLKSNELKKSVTFINRQLQIYKKKTHKVEVLAEIALRLLNYYDVIINRDFYVELVQKSNLWNRIADCQINIKDFYISSKNQLLESLIHYQHLDLEMINECCKEFELKVENYYQLYLKKTLLNWKPEYDKIENVYGDININMKSRDTDLLKKCKEVESLLKDKEALYIFINEFKDEVNFYHYEVFFVIFTILGNLNKSKDYSKYICLLQFLKRYTRVNKPSNNEIEEWYTLFPDSQTIDPLSQWRLPFTTSLFTNDIWKIIRPELSLETYKTWFEVISILETVLNKNEICSYVIKQIISSGILQSGNSNAWVLYSMHDHLFEQVDVCAQEMTNLEMATSAVYQLVMHTPKGADQVNASKLCLKYAIRYKESGSKSDQAISKAFTKVEKKYFGFAANHILHLCQIDSEKYCHLLLDPTELIDTLYMDESILERADRILLNSPDINKAVDELGVLFNLDVHTIRLKLLKSWLSEKVVSNFNLTISNNSNELDMPPAANLKRVVYICQREDITEWQRYLCQIGFDETLGNKYYMANALNCLIIISDVETIERLVPIPYERLLNYIDKLYLLSDLEYFGLTMDVEMLDNYKKTDLLRRLAQNISSPVTVRIMATICMTYGEYDIKFWQLIITSSLKLNLIQHLKKYVNFLQNELEFRYKNFYIMAWQTIIDQSFDINKTDVKEVYNSCLKNIRIIGSCPVLLSLKLYDVFNKCCDLEMYEFAAVITQYFPIEKQHSYIEKISHIPNLSVSVRKLAKFGIWGTEQIQRRMETC